MIRDIPKCERPRERLIAYGVNLDYTTCAYIAVVAVVLGHNYPVFLGFKGGKGVATSLGSMLGMNPLVALLCLGFFIIIVAITKYVSLGSRNWFISCNYDDKS